MWVQSLSLTRSHHYRDQARGSGLGFRAGHRGNRSVG